MDSPLLSVIPADAVKLFLVVFLSFLIGLEREEQKVTASHYAFGGVRTYPLIGLVGYAMAYLSTGELVPLATGFVVVGGFLLVAYWHKMQTSQASGFTSEIAGLTTYLLGALVYGNHLWVATTIAIISLILLELKSTLEGLTQRFSSADILTFTQFLFLTLVILPILPNRAFTPFQLNPFKTWLVVVAVSAISYGSFLLQRQAQGRSGVVLAALLGGAYSSTATTVALAKRSVGDPRPTVYAGSILMASGVMYLRLALLVSLFNQALRQRLLLPLAILGCLGIIVGWIWAARGDRGSSSPNAQTVYPSQNPLELRTAFLFALVFVLMIVVTHYTVLYLGRSGVYALATLMGITDVDPFILGMTQSAGQGTPSAIAGSAIVIAAASNNGVKGLYALIFCDQRWGSSGKAKPAQQGGWTTGQQSFGWLLALALVGLSPLLWLQ